MRPRDPQATCVRNSRIVELYADRVYNPTMEFLEAPAFTKHVHEYLNDDQYRGLQDALARNPELGDVMPSTGGFRKIRFADPRRGKGKRGGLRVIYFWFQEDGQIWMMTIYSKEQADDLTAEQKKALKRAIEAESNARRQLKVSKPRTGRRT